MRQIWAIVCIVGAGLSMTGCATVGTDETASIREWAIPAKAEAVAGRSKWSDYYKGLFDRFDALSTSQDKVFLLEVTSGLIDAAVAFEMGNLEAHRFESLRRNADVALERRAADQSAAADAQARAAWAQTMQSISNSYQQQSQYHQNQLNRRQTCETKRTASGWRTECR
jgi:hypothetical protein